MNVMNKILYFIWQKTTAGRPWMNASPKRSGGKYINPSLRAPRVGGRGFLFPALIVAFLVLNPAGIYADQRPYVFTYPYQQAYPGEWEIETYYDFNIDKEVRGDARYQVEIEHGVTEDYLVGVYADFRDSGQGNGLQIRQYKLVNRFHLAPHKSMFLDPAMYVEYKKSAVDSSKDALEMKLILSRDFGKWNFSTNLIWDKTLDGRSPARFEYTGALAYEFRPSHYYALEIKASPEENKYYLVPNYAIPLSANSHLNMGIGKGLNAESKDFLIRVIFSLEF